MPRPSSPLAARILSVAATEFGTKGFAGARVERIARKAHASKGMIFYLFRSKRMLYQKVVRLIYANLHKRLELIASSNVRPDEKLKGVISEIEDFYDHNHAYLSIMLREATEGGENLDDETLRLLVPVRSAIFDIVHEGIKEGSFRNIPPLVAYYVILSPIMLFLVAAPLRSALSHLRVPTSSDLTPEVFVKHLEETIHAAIRRPSEVVVRPAERLALR